MITLLTIDVITRFTMIKLKHISNICYVLSSELSAYLYCPISLISKMSSDAEDFPVKSHVTQ